MEEDGSDPRPPVFILVCKNTTIAKVFYDWLANDVAPIGIPPAKMEGFRNLDGKINTIRVDSKVVHETDTGEAKSDESRWMRLTLDTIGKTDWPRDSSGKSPQREGCFNQPGGFPKKNWVRLREKVLTKLDIYAIA